MAVDNAEWKWLYFEMQMLMLECGNNEFEKARDFWDRKCTVRSCSYRNDEQWLLRMTRYFEMQMLMPRWGNNEFKKASDLWERKKPMYGGVDIEMEYNGSWHWQILRVNDDTLKGKMLMQECLRRLDYVRMNLKRRKISEKEKVMYVAGVGKSHFVSEDPCVRKFVCGSNN